MDEQERLSGCALGRGLFAGLTSAELDILSRRVLSRAYADGETVRTPSADEDEILLVQEGVVEVYGADPGGRTVVIERLGPGDCLGYAGSVSGHYARASGSVHACLFPRIVFLDLVRAHPDAALRLMERFSGRIGMLETKVCDLALRDVTGRILREYEGIARAEDGVTPEAYTARERLTHEALAARVGATRETVTKALGALQRTGIVRVNRQGLVIVSRTRMQEMRSPLPAPPATVE